MNDLAIWFERNQDRLQAEWLAAVGNDLAATQAYDWPGLFAIVGQLIADDGAASSGSAAALQDWMARALSDDGLPLHGALRAILALRPVLAGQLHRDSERPTAADRLARASNTLDRVALQAAEIAHAQSKEMALRLRAENQELIDCIQQNAKAMQHERDQLEALYTLTRELSASMELKEVMDRTLRIVSSAVGASHGSIMLMDQSQGVLVIRAIMGREKPLPPEGEPTPFAPGKGLAGQVYQNRQTMLIADVLRDPRWVKSKGRGARTRALLLAPLIVDLENYGVMTIADERPGFFTDEHLRLVDTAAGQVARAISNAQLYQFVSDTARELGETLRREQEEASKSQAILQSIGDGVVVTDTQGRIILINAAAERILGTKHRAVIGRDVRNLFSAFKAGGRAEMLEAMEKLAANPMQNRHAPQIIQSELVMEQITVSAHLAPVLGKKNEFMGIVTVFRDITREVQADIAKTEFVSTVSHELRTPLTSIKGYTDLLVADAVGPLTPPQQQFMGIIRNNVNRLTALINDLLDISRIESGRVKLQMEPLSIESVVQDVAESMRPQIEGKGLTLRLDIPEQLPQVHGDRDRLVQVLTNLVGNAYHYTPEGQVSIGISEMTGALRVDVADTGIGITADDQSRIWDRFFRASHPVVEKAAGTGLGLSIVKMFVEMHGGRIWVNSEPGRGSTFTFILPTIDSQGPTLLPPEPKPLPRALGDQKTILVVEDEPDISALIRYQLQSCGYRVLTAALGDEALAKARAEKPDLITLDILLPDRDGFDVLRELKAMPETANIPVLILSIIQDQESGFRLGAVDFLSKPIDEPRLIETIHTILDRKARVLIAEDEPDTAGLLVHMLERAGFATSVAVNGYETLALARREKPGLILLDLRMPGMDGYEALIRLKQDEQTRDIPIITMSAHASDPRSEREKLLSLGAAEFLSKPFTVDELVQEIERAIGEIDQMATLENE
ncbi:MAG: response regulator [Chloroflexota bacterium]